MSKGEFSGIHKRKSVPIEADSFVNQAKVDGVKEDAKEKTKRLNVELPESKFKEFKAKAASNGKTLREVVEVWVNDYLSK